MSDNRPKPPDAESLSTNSVVRRLAGRYLFVLVAVAALVVVDQAIVQPLLVRLNAFAPAINVAGRQRMLSQKLTKAALEFDAASDDATRSLRRDELQSTLERWTAEHAALLEGDRQLGIQPIHSPELTRQWAALDPHFQAMVAAANDLFGADASASHSVATIVEHESEYLPTMDRIVGLMEVEAAHAVGRLRMLALAISATVILLLLGLGWFVVRPATRTIRSQVDELESRVAARTRELSSALASLRHEIHERQLAESRNQRLAAQLTHAERVATMGHLTAGLAHELNQPLAAITNYADACEVILDEQPISDGRVRQCVSHAKRAALRAGQIVRRMRNFVQPNTATVADVGINALVAEVVELCRNEAARAGVDVRLQLSADTDQVCVDAIQIQQVLVNLVQNAIQAMREVDGLPRELLLQTSSDSAAVRVEVLDTGPGFAATDPDAAFAAFHTTKADGLGIGLAICRSIVQQHRGTIWAESRPGGGAQVTFTLPLAPTDAERDQIHSDCVCC
jgi:two-component system, LuxR family, sensor kinase FixL